MIRVASPLCRLPPGPPPRHAAQSRKAGAEQEERRRFGDRCQLDVSIHLDIFVIPGTGSGEDTQLIKMGWIDIEGVLVVRLRSRALVIKPHPPQQDGLGRGVGQGHAEVLLICHIVIKRRVAQIYL